jgi:hypothetical protein
MTLSTGGRRRRTPGPVERSADQRLATMHLKTGLLTLARAELETMAGDGLLDDEALIDLAEVRWRTGDLPGAGEAADAYLEAGHESTLGLVIAAEAQAALGRPTEARRLADRAVDRSDRSLDAIFAGLPRSSIWPREASAELMAQPEGPGSGGPVASRRGAGRARTADGRTGDAPTTRGDGPASAPTASAPMPGGLRALDAAKEALAAGDPAAASLHLSLALRVSPALAPAVLDLVRDREGAAFDLVRGDAFRIVGREAEARRAFASAAGPTDAPSGADMSPGADGPLPTDTAGEP